MRRDPHRAAWTEFVTGHAAPANKYNVAPKSERGKYASKHEADVAQRLWALASRGLIEDLKEQVKIVLVEGDGKMRSICYVADFTWKENGKEIVGDAKGVRTPIYRLKKKLLWILHGIEIREL